MERKDLAVKFKNTCGKWYGLLCKFPGRLLSQHVKGNRGDISEKEHQVLRQNPETVHMMYIRGRASFLRLAKILASRAPSYLRR